MPTQPLGWFKAPITSAEQLRGLKYRTVGLATDLFNSMGAAVTALPGGEIVPALERGVIDGAEFNNPSSDRVLGFPDVAKNYMLQSYHQNTETFEVLVNKPKYEALPAELKAIIRHSAEAASADMSWKQQLRYPNDLQAMATSQGVTVGVTPRAVLDAQLRAWDGVIRNLEIRCLLQEGDGQPARLVPPRQRLLPALPGEPGTRLQSLLRPRLTAAR